MEGLGELHKLFRENEGYLIDLFKGGKARRVTYYFDQYLRKKAAEDKDFLGRWGLVLAPVPPPYVPLAMVLDVERYPGALVEMQDPKSSSRHHTENSLIDMLTPGLLAAPQNPMPGMFYAGAHGMLPGYPYMPVMHSQPPVQPPGSEASPMPNYAMLMNMNYPMMGLVNGMPQMMAQTHLAPPRMMPGGYYPGMAHPMQGMRKKSLKPAYMMHPGYILPNYMMNPGVNPMPVEAQGNRAQGPSNPPTVSGKSSQRKNSHNTDHKTSVGKDNLKNRNIPPKIEERENNRVSSESSGKLGRKEDEQRKEKRFKEDQENSKILNLLKKVKTSEVDESGSVEPNRKQKAGGKKHEKRRSKSRDRSRSKSRGKQAGNTSSKRRIELLNKKYNSLFAKKDDLKDDQQEADVEMSPRSPSEDKDV
jgi:hypothetical protein